MAYEKKYEDVNLIPLDAPLSIEEPAGSWLLAQNYKGADWTRLSVPDTDLTGKWVLITGSNNGIGRQAAIRFARSGAHIIIAAREAPSTETDALQVIQECQYAAKQAGKLIEVEWWQVDFAKLESVEALARRWLDTGRPLDILCNNAGMGASPAGAGVLKTKDGFEIIHQVNFLAHVLLTLQLLPSISKAAAPRIVCTTSCFHYLGKFDLANCNGELGQSGPDGVRFYQNNKLWFQVWLTELQRRLLQHKEYRHITVNGVHPGYVNSGIWNLPGNGWLTPIKTALVKFQAYFLAIDEQQGSLAIIHGATGIAAGPHPAIQGIGVMGGLGGGQYFSRTTRLEPMPHTQDPDCRQRIWRKVNEELHLNDKGLLDILGLKYVESSQL